MDKDNQMATPALRRLEAQLQAEKAKINEEIRNYPPPIPACDAQFNYLLEKRDNVTVRLSRLRTISEKSLTAAELADALSEFSAQSQSLAQQAKSKTTRI